MRGDLSVAIAVLKLRVWMIVLQLSSSSMRMPKKHAPGVISSCALRYKLAV